MYVSVHRPWLTAEVKEWACAEPTLSSMHQEAPKFALVALILRSLLYFWYAFIDSMTAYAAARICTACLIVGLDRSRISLIPGYPGKTFRSAQYQ